MILRLQHRESFLLRKEPITKKYLLQNIILTLEGEDSDKTIIIYDIARDEWRCDHADDWGVATMNLNGNDITLKNLTIANNYGFDYIEPRTVICASDSTKKKVITNGGHQMALRSMKSNKIKGDQLPL